MPRANCQSDLLKGKGLHIIAAQHELPWRSAGERQYCEETNQGRSAVIGAQRISEPKRIDSKRVKRHCVLKY
jgi:hypothetical protein